MNKYHSIDTKPVWKEKLSPEQESLLNNRYNHLLNIWKSITHTEDGFNEVITEILYCDLEPYVGTLTKKAKAYVTREWRYKEKHYSITNYESFLVSPYGTPEEIILLQEELEEGDI